MSVVVRHRDCLVDYLCNADEGSPYDVTLPPDIGDGEYLVRHEIIALHSATELYKAQFYPTCTQIRIHYGVNNKCPSPTVSFPGAYHARDPGLYRADVSVASFWTQAIAEGDR